MRDSQQATAVREWAESLPAAIRSDTLWRMEAYRLGLYVCDVAWEDVTTLCRDPRTKSLLDQLYRALGSISASIAEGYSRGGGRDRARFLEYALGCAREARDWYVKARHVLGPDRVGAQVEVLTSGVRLLLVMTKDQRTVHLREPGAAYDVSPQLDSTGSHG